ncbi:helix-turn-helix domain-containing protein [Paenibacillus sp. TRM 82003]|uniref:helix-turn-helix domain-containing protein n=1 Tax=Kineococcus sp. TRM81007 TaxID=2925831 RepID=UPI001F570441|nr:helix-turn-helix transcriptional regulator [Kineococcus sp. TRM81007]MCI2237346.1 helix-turn-helix domain-containing protein [Kineococcus sp. TRM81007]MCI3926547.1 helix-turn-helix domain-containing protein [Paenibacillus sp. TRM 82003]
MSSPAPPPVLLPVRARPGPLLRELVGSVLREERVAQGRTLAAVAAVSGVSLPHLSQVERGGKEPSSEVVAAICGALGLPLAELLRRAAGEPLDVTSSARSGARPVAPPGTVSLSLAA